MTAYQHEAKPLLRKANRQQPNKVPGYPFCSLLSGWQRLFAPAKSLFYRCWRLPRRRDGP